MKASLWSAVGARVASLRSRASVRLASPWRAVSATVTTLKDLLYAIAFTAAAFLVAMLIAWVLPARALEQTPDGYRLTPHEQARCLAGGGCIVMPQAEFEQELVKWLRKAYLEGRAQKCGA